MSINTKLFIGLGNPGSGYINTRHNLGFVVLDAIAENLHLEFKSWNNMADISFYSHNNGRVWLLKPTTFMNLSGVPISSFAKYYKIKPEEIFIFYDDFSIALGEYRIRMSGSSGGHNGIQSIIEHLNTQNFPRMKLGIGPLSKNVDVASFVLSKFLKEDKEKINLMKETILLAFKEIIKSGIDKAASTLANKGINNNVINKYLKYTI
ncbi:MAG: aminoacyl-tRNA hydrolase [Endomicrobium sp.]|jgi:PTH1 family peptidyl-tRNA hydrolase|nr:aminoacyl-tRNA hydrolase [Endomicrobium sp.]